MKYDITLQDADKVLHSFETESQEFIDVSIVLYKGDYFTYGSMVGGRFNKIRFNKVKPPFEIPGK